MRGLKVIIGMDWLEANGAMIACEHQLVRVRTPSGESWLLKVKGPRRDRPSIRLRGLVGFYSRVARGFWLISQTEG